MEICKNLKAGITFQFKDVILKPIESNSGCRGCYFSFMTLGLCNRYEKLGMIPSCESLIREDRTNVVFVKVIGETKPTIKRSEKVFFLEDFDGLKNKYGARLAFCSSKNTLLLITSMGIIFEFEDITLKTLRCFEELGFDITNLVN